ncbi:hypothetical protein NUW54_g9096 [Trametes sanguinea]|uniref:Uncharacterized protein n=1 Tax=Trametes sanguinea TaxID=158606 RepID=A0ACC1PA95_9APHY|nr:hypothetical protein NUW54_g9096 [Trametes sanguinea]
MSKKRGDIDVVLAARQAEEDTPPSKMLALRSAIARELLAKETQEYRTALQLECEELRTIEEQQEEVARQTQPTPPSGDPQALAREKLATVVQPLLQLIRDHTGFYVTLLAGLPHPTGNLLKVVSAGKSGGPVPLPWHLHDVPRFKRDVMGSFTAFLAHTAGWTLHGAIQPHIDVYVSDETYEEVERAFPYLVNKKFASGGGDVPEFKWHRIEDRKPFEIGDTGIIIDPFKGAEAEAQGPEEQEIAHTTGTMVNSRAFTCNVMKREGMIWVPGYPHPQEVA